MLYIDTHNSEEDYDQAAEIQDTHLQAMWLQMDTQSGNADIVPQLPKPILEQAPHPEAAIAGVSR